MRRFGLTLLIPGVMMVLTNLAFPELLLNNITSTGALELNESGEVEAVHSS